MTFMTWAAIIITLSMAVLSAMMFVLGKERLHFVWGFFCTIVTLWIGGFYAASLSQSPDYAELWWKISYIGIILIPFVFFHFILEFTTILRKYKTLVIWFLYLIALVFVYININTNLIIKGVVFLFDQMYYGLPGKLHPYFLTLYLILVLSSFYAVFKEYKKSTDPLFRQRSIYFFISNAIAFIGGSLNFLPIYGIDVPPITNASVAIGAALLTYSILRYQLFNTRVVTAQLLTLILGAFTLGKLITSASTTEFVLNLLFLIVTLTVGINLILSVRKEVEDKDKLQVANEGQSNLIHIMNHQIKGYLSKSRNIFSELLSDEEYGPINEGAKAMITEGFTSLTEGVGFVQQVLNGSSADSGTLTYLMNTINMKELVEDVVKHQMGHMESKGLAYTLTIDEGDYTTIGDNVQLRETVRNLIDNSINYTPAGSINMHLSEKDNKILFTVQDTGVGVTLEDMPKIFLKGGRGKDSLKININSTGYGLAFVKAVVEAHKGRVWVESEGAGKGSTFYLELPVTK